MNTQNYNNVVTFPEGKPYKITTGNALIFSLSNIVYLQKFIKVMRFGHCCIKSLNSRMYTCMPSKMDLQF